MSQENVVPFESPTRRAMARRGSADKALAIDIVEMPCPYCDAILCLETGLLTMGAEVLCAGCRTVIDLGNRETMDVGG